MTDLLVDRLRTSHLVLPGPTAHAEDEERPMRAEVRLLITYSKPIRFAMHGWCQGKQENAVRRATYDPLGEHGPSIERFSPRLRAGDR